MSTNSASIKKELKECLTQQLSEIDLLKSMYPNPGDVILSENNVEAINNFINAKSEYIPNNLDFVINLILGDIKLEVCVNLPLLYPNEEPDIYIRCNQLNRQQETTLNAGLSKCIKNNHVGEVCLYTAITWLQDNRESFITSKDEEISKCNEPQDENIMFSRIWIYSHHIYSMKKRVDIVKLAKEFELTGFCLPGKPGVICIEGVNSYCDQWWKNIKSMCWKKIAIRQTEIFQYSEEPKQRKFSDFKELYFENPTNSKTANMSNFSKFMNENGFGKIFNEIFLSSLAR